MSNDEPTKAPPVDPDIAAALGQITVALRRTSTAINLIQAEMLQRMQSFGMFEIRAVSDKLSEEVDAAWQSVQKIFERISKNG